MRNHSAHTWKAALARVLVAVMVVLSVALVPTTTIKSATAPALTKSSKSIMLGSTYDLNVKNKIAKSTYKWTTSDKKVATVSSKGIVKGIKAGSAVITCTVTAPKKTYELTCKVTVIKPALVFRIKNKVTALNLGQEYDLNRIIAPSSSNDKTTWTSSDTTIAAPDKLGKFTALKEGTVTITGKTLSGKTDSITIKVVDKDGIVTNQKELDALLGTGIGLITIKTSEVVDLKIKGGDYTNTKLVVDAPKADIHNNGVFASIEIVQIAANSWYENAVGNLLHILSKDSRIVVGPSAKVKIEVTAEGAKITVENNGVVEELVIDKKANITISGNSKTEIPVVANAPFITITSSIALDITCKANIELILLAGAEKTKIHVASADLIPIIKGNVTVKVIIGTGDTAKEQEVKGTPITSGTGGGTGGGDPTVPTTYTKIFSLGKPISEISAIKVTYEGKNYTIGSTALASLVKMLNNESAYIDIWKDTTDYSKTTDGQTFTITGTKGSVTKNVAFTGGQLDGKSYTVTYNTDGSVTVVSNTTKVSFNVKKYNDVNSLVISGDKTKLEGLSFSIVANGTYYLDKSYKELKAIDVTYGGKTYSVTSGTLATLKLFLGNEDGYLGVWNSISTPVVNEYDGQTVTVSGIKDSIAKTVTFGKGPLEGRSYTVTVNTDHSVTVVSNASGVSFTISKGADEKSLTITGAPVGLDFDPIF